MTTGKIVFKNTNINLFFKFILVATLLYYIRVEFIRVINLYTINNYLSGFFSDISSVNHYFLLK